MSLGRRPAGPDLDEAEAIALMALGFLAEDEARLIRFVTATGVMPDQLRTAASSPATLVAVLDHMLADESQLLVFTSGAGVDPAWVTPARELLAEGAPRKGRR